MTWTEEFKHLDRYYPGSNRKISPELINTIPPTTSDVGWSWSARPRKYEKDGKYYEFFSIRDLASALNKAPVTMRLWEDQGILPLALRSPSVYEDKRHRIYTFPQIDGIVQIAGDEGILGATRIRWKETKFQPRVLALFQELAKQPLNGARLWETVR